MDATFIREAIDRYKKERIMNDLGLPIELFSSVLMAFSPVDSEEQNMMAALDILLDNGLINEGEHVKLYNRIQAATNLIRDEKGEYTGVKSSIVEAIVAKAEYLTQDNPNEPFQENRMHIICLAIMLAFVDFGLITKEQAFLFHYRMPYPKIP